MNDEEKKKIIKKLSPEHKKTLKQWAEKTNMNIKELVATFCELYAQPEAEETYGDNEEERIAYAISGARAQAGSELATPTEEVEIYVLGIDPPRQAGGGSSDDGNTNIVGSVFGIGVSDSNKSLKEVVINGWNEESDKINDFEYGESFKVNARRTNKTNNKLKYSLVKHSKIEKADFKPKNIQKILNQLYPTVEIARAENNESKGPNDLKVIKGYVESINLLNSKDGKKRIRADVMDNSIGPNHIDDYGLFSVIMPAEMCNFGPQSEMYFIGRINISEEYGPGMFVSGVAPSLIKPQEHDFSKVEENEISEDDIEQAVESDDDIEEVEGFDDELI